ncbi:MAG: LacI family DNA-binding transcriptional regulator [Bacteroidota bacterium]
MKGKRITIKDIAQRLNLSTSTVSRALTSHSDVKAETRKLVTSLAKELDYYPDPLAVNLKQRKTKIIGLILPKIVNRFFSKALAGIQEVVNREGYNIIISQSDESIHTEKKNVEDMLANRVDGLLVSLSKETMSAEHFLKVLNTETPIVFFDRVNEELETSRVIIDDYEASYKAVDHLIEQGCKRIAHVAGPPNLINCKNRLEGYKDAIKNNGIFLDKKLIVFSSYERDDVEVHTKYFLSLKHPPDGIFAINDASAIQMIHHIKKAGFSIPGDIAIVGFNNEANGEFIDPPLSTVDSPALQLGKSAARLLFDHIDNEERPATCEIIKSRLVIRESSLRSNKK